MSFIDFGSEFEVKLNRRVLPSISSQLNRHLTPQECRDLHKVINNKFKEAIDNRTTEWNEWLQNDHDLPFHVDLPVIGDLGWECNYPKDIHVCISKKRDGKGYIAEVSYGRSIQEFRVSCRRIKFRKFAYDNLFGSALQSIGKIVCTNCGWIDGVVQNLFKEYDRLLDSEKKEGFLLPTGMKLRPNILEEYQSYSEIALLFKPINSEEWDILVVVDDDCDNPITIEDCVPEIYRRIDRKKLWSALEVLAAKADSEDWSYKGNRYGALRYYVESVYDHLQKEHDGRLKNDAGKVHQVFSIPKENDAMVFCTGLVTPDEDGAHYIYAYCSSPNKDGIYQNIEWLSHSGSRAKGVTYNPKLAFDNNRINHGLPYPPHWVSAPERLLFDYRFGSITEGQIRFSESHIYKNLCERLPDPIRDQFREEFPCYEDKKAEFKEYLENAWRVTRKILQKSFKVAIPTYYRGEIQMLVPLYFDNNNKQEASVALVVTLDKTGQSHYFCPTCLTLEMARVDSRVITRIDDTWLKGV